MLGAAWKEEPPLLLQIRNLLAQLISLNAASQGVKVDPSSFIPQRLSEADELEKQRQQALIWAAKHNATLQ